jgi:acyl-CoA synthetase (AMP-forming)/AMP-acid ligase II
MASSRIEIRRPDGSQCDAGEVGEIVCFSDRLMSHYWRRPEATAESLRDGGYYSGDAGYVDETGYLYVVDRIKDMVISGGENIYPAQIEQVFYTHPDLLDAAIIGVPDPRWGESLLAIVVMREGRTLDPDAMINFLRPQLAGYKIPRSYREVDALPRNATGKVLKTALRERFA